MQNNLSNFIDGSWESGNGESLISYNPCNNAIIWQGCMADEIIIEDAYIAASNAFKTWGILDFAKRLQYIINFKNTVEKYKAELIFVIAEETGKPFWEAQTEVEAVINKVNISINAFKMRTNNYSIAQPDNTLGHVRYKPHGVVCVLGPFNFPAHLSNGHIIPALLAGNTVIYKPSNLTPKVATFILQCWQKSGVPNGVLNLVQGDANIAKKLFNFPINGIFFTGSLNAGIEINQKFATKPEVIIALELGGNNPLIIDTKVADKKALIYNTILSTMFTAGQRCTCARRLFIEDNSTSHLFLNDFISQCKNIKIGPPNKKNEAFMGPVISYEHAKIHLNHQDELIEKGGKALLKMNLLDENSGFLSPGIIDMSGATNLEDKEIFAPLVQIFFYKNFDEALFLANQTQYGLTAGIFTDSPETYHKFYNSIKAGIINWNKPTTGASSNLPFGGVGHSGNHRPSAYFAADYCAYPVSGLEQNQLTMPNTLLPGIL